MIRVSLGEQTEMRAGSRAPGALGAQISLTFDSKMTYLPLGSTGRVVPSCEYLSLRLLLPGTDAAKAPHARMSTVLGS